MIQGDLAIDDIVKRVLEQLQKRSDVNPAPTPQIQGPQPTTLSASVITEKTLEELGSSVKEVIIPERTILTPTARDYIRNHKIQIRRGSKTIPNKETKPSWTVLLAEAGQSLKGSLAAVKKSEPGSFQEQLVDSTAAAVTHAQQELARGGVSGVVLCTNRVAWASCEVNRSTAVRGMGVRRIEDMKEIEDLKPNVICIPGSTLSFSDYLQIFRALSKTAVSTGGVK